jgi:hypothetical protein
MQVVLISFIGICLFLACLIAYRNDKTLIFSLTYIDATFKVIDNFYNEIKDDQELRERMDELEVLKKMQQQILLKNSYSKILFSLKPFKLESWFTPEEVEFIKRGL